ncbi:MAG: IS1380 family transposase [bacterium]|nr:IS1380 family transposase [bacterium]
MQVSSTRDVRVSGGGGQVAAHSGLFALGRFADGLGLGEALSAAVPDAGERAPVHDRGKVLVHLLLMLAGGGEACSDIEHLRAQPVLFGEVASDSTLYRALRGLGPDVVEGLWEAAAGVRAGVWERRGDASGPVVLDIDSTLVEVHSENKQGAAAHFKGGFGFHPMLCATDDGELLSIKLRAGNAAANHICDHIEVLDAAVAQLPAAVARGHRPGDGQAPSREVHLRVDAAGCSVGIAEACRDREVGFFMTARSNQQVEAAIDHSRFDARKWQPALGADGEPSKRAQVAELTESVDLSGWPSGTRLIARREPLHPGAQRTLFDSGNWRYRGFYTDAAGRPAELDAHMRAHARIENTIADLKDSGLKRMPFKDFEANAAWAALVALSLALVKWFQQLRLTGPLAHAAPKRLRWQLWHAPARLVRSSRKHTLRLLDWWPATPQLLHACQPHAP